MIILGRSELPRRVRAGWAARGPLHLLDLTVHVVGDLVIAAVDEVLMDQCGPHRRVTRPVHQLTGRGAAGRGGGVPGVPEIVEVDVTKPQGHIRFHPDRRPVSHRMRSDVAEKPIHMEQQLRSTMRYCVAEKIRY
ncbi:hypothetical protein [Streptomyces sp. 142MFCol3.1]|uniref:hypothetical protein n=1 Tax=Streptomyces sp. 142MFCol3.1 TaxID=1172179 RepID=UPI00131A463E|nr:hypothetical protein [Streptomyces sp. 142MFCol3.1]